MKVLEPRDTNGYLDQCIKKKFGSKRKFAAAVEEHPPRVSNVVNKHWILKPEEKQKWANILCDGEATAQDINDLFGE